MYDGETTGLSSDSKKRELYAYIKDSDLQKEWRKFREKYIYMDIEEAIIYFLVDECEHWKWDYQWIDTYKNFFLTQKACEDHIKLNHHHYTDAQPYLFHAWRNPEMEIVQQFLCELT